MRPIIAEARQQNRRRHIAHDLAGNDRHFKRMTAHQGCRQRVERRHALHIADENEEHDEGQRQPPIDLPERLAIGEQEHAEHHDAHHPDRHQVAHHQQAQQEQCRIHPHAPAAMAGTIAGQADFVRLRLVWLRSKHPAFDILPVKIGEPAYFLAAERHRNHQNQQYRSNKRIRGHDAEELSGRHA